MLARLSTDVQRGDRVLRPARPRDGLVPRDQPLGRRVPLGHALRRGEWAPPLSLTHTRATAVRYLGASCRTSPAVETPNLRGLSPIDISRTPFHLVFVFTPLRRRPPPLLCTLAASTSCKVEPWFLGGGAGAPEASEFEAFRLANPAVRFHKSLDDVPNFPKVRGGGKMRRGEGTKMREE